MKKSLLSCVFVWTAATVTAWPNIGDINITATDIGNGQLMIGYYTDDPLTAPPIGISLGIELSNGVTVSGVSNVISISEYFPVYPDYAVMAPESYEIGLGHPLADTLGPNPIPSPTSTFSISMGAIGENYLFMPPGDISDPDYEYHPSDFTMDGVIDLDDLRVLTNDWLSATYPAGPLYLPSDLNSDGQVDMADYALFMGPASDAPLEVTNLITLQLEFGPVLDTEVTLLADEVRAFTLGAEMNFIMPGPITVNVPEPATLALLGIGCLLLGKRRS